MKSKKWSQNFDWRPWNGVIVVLSYFCANGLKGPRGKQKRLHRGKNDPAYENFAKKPPEKWGQAEEKFRPVHY